MSQKLQKATMFTQSPWMNLLFIYIFSKFVYRLHLALNLGCFYLNSLKFLLGYLNLFIYMKIKGTWILFLFTYAGGEKYTFELILFVWSKIYCVLTKYIYRIQYNFIYFYITYIFGNCFGGVLYSTNIQNIAFYSMYQNIFEEMGCIRTSQINLVG